MRARRPALALAALATLAVTCVEPAAAQSVNRNLIGELNRQLLYVALPLTVFVEVILVYAVLRFRDNDEPRPTIDDPPLEITWTIATAIILLFVGVSAYVVLTSPYVTPGQVQAAGSDAGDERIRGLSYQWAWEFTYPAADLTTRDLLVLPANRSVTLQLTSADVIHSLFVPGLGVKQDAFPGQYNDIRTLVRRQGRYRAYCTELCGVGHSRMRADVIVVNRSAYTSWLNEYEGENNVTAGPTPTPDAGR